MHQFKLVYNQPCSILNLYRYSASTTMNRVHTGQIVYIYVYKFKGRKLEIYNTLSVITVLPVLPVHRDPHGLLCCVQVMKHACMYAQVESDHYRC